MTRWQRWKRAYEAERRRLERIVADWQAGLEISPKQLAEDAAEAKTSDANDPVEKDDVVW